jgi:hypothetical protein
LNSGKKISVCATKKINILTRFVRKTILNETPPLQVKWSNNPTPFKLNGPYLRFSCYLIQGYVIIDDFVLFKPLDFLALNELNGLFTLSVPGEGYFRNALCCILNADKIFKLLLMH